MNTSLAQLIAQRDLLEIEADAITSELTSLGVNGEKPIGLDGPLIDAEGYPRGDIDILNAKQKRARLNTIRYDHKEIMKKLEKELHSAFSEMPAQIDISHSTPSDSLSGISSKPHENLRPIAIINEILEGSPAMMAGLKNGDELIRFGTVDSIMENPLSHIPAALKASINTPITLLVRRVGAASVIEISLVPAVWGGRGLLGCFLAPVKA